MKTSRMTAWELVVTVLFCLVCNGEGHYFNRYSFDRDDTVKRNQLGEILMNVDRDAPKPSTCIAGLSERMLTNRPNKKLSFASLKIESGHCRNDSSTKEWWFIFNTSSWDISSGSSINPRPGGINNGNCIYAVTRTSYCPGNTIHLPIEVALVTDQ